MKKIFANIGSFFSAIGIGFLIVAVCYAISWIATCGIIKLITLCFGWTFSWAIATGIWLILCLIRLIFNKVKG